MWRRLINWFVGDHSDYNYPLINERLEGNHSYPWNDTGLDHMSEHINKLEDERITKLIKKELTKQRQTVKRKRAKKGKR